MKHDLIVEVKFEYDGPKAKTYPDGYKAVLENFYMDRYNLFCDLVNPLFEKWNAEYTGTDDDILFEDGSTNPDSEYNRYIIAKETEIVERYMQPLLKGSLSIKRYFIGEMADFRIELKDGTKMSMWIKPVKSKEES